MASGGSCRCLRRNLPRAEDLVDRARKLAATLSDLDLDRAQVAAAVMPLRAMQARWADVAAAGREALEVLAARLPGSALEAVTRQGLATALRALGQYDEALREITTAIARYEALLLESPPWMIAGVRQIHAALLADRGQHDEARAILERATRDVGAGLGSTHPELIPYLDALAESCARQGDHAQSIEHRVRLSTIIDSSLGADAHEAEENLHRLVHEAAAANRMDLAVESARRLCEACFARAAADLPLLAREERLSLANRIEDAIEHLLSALSNGGAIDATTLYAQVARWKGVAGRAQARVRRMLDAGRSESRQALLQRVHGARADLAVLVRAPRTTEVDARIDALRSSLARDQRDLLASIGVAPILERIDVPRLGRLLPAGSALVDFAVLRHTPLTRTMEGRTEPGDRGPQHLHAFVVPSGATAPVLLDLGPMEPLGAAIDLVVRRYGDRGRQPTTAPLSEDRAMANDVLAARVWDRIQSVTGQVDTLFLATDGDAGKLAFGALRRKDGTFLVESIRFVTVSDALDLCEYLGQQGATRTSAPSLLIVAGVDYSRSSPTAAASAPSTPAGDARRSRWPSLDQTAAEAAAILALHERLGGTEPELLSGQAATKRRLQDLAGRHAVLHLATHGYFEPDGLPSLVEAMRDELVAREQRPDEGFEFWRARTRTLAGVPTGLLSGLVLAGANATTLEAAGDGYLSAEEILSLDLGRCELVVLSACDTGLGMARGGQGMQSVRNAFHEAGARTVISSLWSVPDEATSELMVEFYRRLWQDKRPPGEALRGAQLWMLDKNRKKDGDPRPETWGAFVLSGDWR